MVQRRAGPNTGGTIRIPRGVRQATDDISEFSFAKYAITYFTPAVSGQYCQRPLSHSLLPHDEPMDELAAQTIWIMVLRFMGDIDGIQYDEALHGPIAQTSLMKGIILNLSNDYAQTNQYKAALNSELQNDRLFRMTLKSKAKLSELQRININEQECYPPVLSKYCNNLDKVHFIIGHGILRPTLRDEILAQICKQLTHNPHRTSYAKGWILLSLCIGCFPPSPHFEPYLRCFLREGPDLYASYSENRLDRTVQNGARTQPPSWLELEATRGRTPINLNIHLMDGNVKKLQTDPASTAREVIAQLAADMELTDAFGFCLTIALFDKKKSLGSGRLHIFDIISKCEQYAKEQGHQERDTPWKLYMRKELFTAWYDPAQSKLAAHLIYMQIKSGLNIGEYRCRTEKDVAMICALAYYAEHGAPLNPFLLSQMLPDLVPQDMLATGDKAVVAWESRVRNAFINNEYVKRRAPREHAKEDICMFAKITWPMLFARFFEAVRLAGPVLLSNNVVIAVNSVGIYFIDEMEQILAELLYAEILAVYVDADEKDKANRLCIDTVQHEDFIFQCYEALDVSELVSFMIRNLKLRSKYGVAVQDYLPCEGSGGERLDMWKGDLVRFAPGITGVMILDKSLRWARGICRYKVGEFPTEIVTVLPSLSQPSKKVLQIYKDSLVVGRLKSQTSTQNSTIKKQEKHSLMKFALEYFELNTAQRSDQKATRNDIWCHTRSLIKQPLLKSLQNDPNLFAFAVDMFHNILKYMGDVPCGKTPANTNSIFQTALQHELLRDELYCQIMKQLSKNRIHLSEERGWDLLYLATGMTHPSVLVMRELLDFLRTRLHTLTIECLKRVKRTIINGSRKYGPNNIEIEAIQQRCMHIYHKVFFPDNTVAAFEIESSTRGADLTAAIIKHLGVQSDGGFSLFMNIGECTFSIPEREFVLDFISEVLNWRQQTMPNEFCDKQNDHQYYLYFMKKLWLNRMQPGTDRNADALFHYPQEESKYLDGYYKVDLSLAIQLAALCYMANNGRSLTAIQRIHEILPLMVPEILLPLIKIHEWKMRIMRQLNALIISDITEISAKENFLELLSVQPLFGSTFFLVEQTSDTSMPDIVLIAVNRFGFHIIHPESKDMLISYGYEDLSFWSSGDMYFHIRFGNLIGSTKLLCRTSQGYKIDDLISSYIKHLKT